MRSNKYIFLFVAVFSSCVTDSPVTHPCIYKGHLANKIRTYNFKDGKAIHMTTEIRRSGNVEYEKVYTEQWPNGEYKKIGKNGFVKWKDGQNMLNAAGAKVPDDVLVQYFDENIETQYWIYKDGQKLDYNAGFAPGTQVNIHTGDKHGVYIWREGKLQFLREYTPEEKSTWENAMKVLHSKDSLMTNPH